VFGVVAVIC